MDKDGNGFSITEPYIEDNMNSKDEAISKSKELTVDGFQQVTVFSFVDKLPEYVSWNYVMEHKEDEQ